MLLRCAGKPTRHRFKLDMNVRKTGAKDGIEGLAQSIHNLRYMHKVKNATRAAFFGAYRARVARSIDVRPRGGPRQRGFSGSLARAEIRCLQRSAPPAVAVREPWW